MSCISCIGCFICIDFICFIGCMAVLAVLAVFAVWAVLAVLAVRAVSAVLDVLAVLAVLVVLAVFSVIHHHSSVICLISHPQSKAGLPDCLISNFDPTDRQRTDNRQTTEFFFGLHCCRGLPSGWPNNE